MTLTNTGFAGTVDEAQFARLMSMVGAEFTVGGPSEFRVSHLLGDRRVSVAAGAAYGHGVLVESDEPIILDLDNLSAGGRWDLIALRRTWGEAPSTSVVPIPGPTTSTTTPSVPPAAYPADFDSEPGVRADQPLAWTWVTAATTVVRVYDLRTRRPVGEMDWSTWTPSIIGANNSTATKTCRYKFIGGRALFQIKIVLGASPSVTGAILVPLPFEIQKPVSRYAFLPGTAQAFDTSAASSPDVMSVRVDMVDGSRVVIQPFNGRDPLAMTPTSPFTWASGDVIHAEFWGDPV